MKKEEILKFVKDIGALENVEDIRAKLVDLEKTLNEDYTQAENHETEIASLKERNNKLTNANMELYLQVGSGKEDPKKDKDEPDNEDLKYEDLFNEEGGLK